MRWPPKNWTITSLSVLAFLATTIVALNQMEERLHRVYQRAFDNSIAAERITWLDQILTANARLAAHTGNPRYLETYHQADERLTAALEIEASNAASEAFPALFRTADTFHEKLHEAEHLAFQWVADGELERAYQWLTSERYEGLTTDYANAVASLYRTMEGELENQHTKLHTLVRRLALTTAAITMGMMVLAIWYRGHRSRLQVNALRATLRTVMDVVGNVLNQLQMFRLEAEDADALPPDTLTEFDTIIEDCSKRLIALGENERFTTHATGAGPAVDIPEHKSAA